MTHLPPLQSKYEPEGLTPYQLKLQRQQARNEKARLQMARKRAELKSRPLEEQQVAADRSRAYQATYRAKHRNVLRVWEFLRRRRAYMRKHGPDAYAAYEQQKRVRKEERQRRRRRLSASKPTDHNDPDPDLEDAAPSESDCYSDESGDD